jgi:putative NIF3 family GTP cyclohydrolase 1 type 2
MNRRTFLIATTALAAAQQTAQQTAQQKGGVPPTAAQIIDRIRKNVGVPWRAQTVDNLIAGNPDTPVRGIATTMMATLDVLQRSAAAGLNLIVTHEPTFWSHQDQTAALLNDPVYKFKTDFIRQHDMVVFHFHDHWHAHRPDGIATGMMRDLGWEKNVVDPADPREFILPATTLARLTGDIAARLGIRTMRIVGDAALPVRRVIASWGYVMQENGIALLNKPGVDALICGETREWELVEYAQDAISAGQKKALILMGHVVSEQSGMKYCAEWLRQFVTEAPVEFIPAPEPFRTPSLPPNPAAA